MPDASPSTVRLRKIGRSLRHLREEAGQTLKTAGRHLERSGSSLSLIENGLQPLRLRDLEHILNRYQVPLPESAALMTLAEQQQQSGWWTSYKDFVSHETLDRVSLEFSASRIMTTETTFIPGLLQTEDYAHALNRAGLPDAPAAVVSRYVDFRLQRQQILKRPDPTHLYATLDEGALRRIRGGRYVMRAQLKRLLNESEQEHVFLRVLPFTADAGPHYVGQFQLVDIGTPPILSVVLVDHLTGHWILEDEAQVERFREKSNMVEPSTLSEAESRTLIQSVMSDL